MTVLVVLAIWFGLGCLTWAMFAAVVRGAQDVDAPGPTPREHGELPGPRAGSDRVVRPSTRA